MNQTEYELEIEQLILDRTEREHRRLLQFRAWSESADGAQFLESLRDGCVPVDAAVEAIQYRFADAFKTPVGASS